MMVCRTRRRRSAARAPGQALDAGRHRRRGARRPPGSSPCERPSAGRRWRARPRARPAPPGRPGRPATTSGRRSKPSSAPLRRPLLARLCAVLVWGLTVTPRGNPVTGAGQVARGPRRSARRRRRRRRRRPRRAAEPRRCDRAGCRSGRTLIIRRTCSGRATASSSVGLGRRRVVVRSSGARFAWRTRTRQAGPVVRLGAGGHARRQRRPAPPGSPGGPADGRSGTAARTGPRGTGAVAGRRVGRLGGSPAGRGAPPSGGERVSAVGPARPSPARARSHVGAAGPARSGRCVVGDGGRDRRGGRRRPVSVAGAAGIARRPTGRTTESSGRPRLGDQLAAGSARRRWCRRTATP